MTIYSQREDRAHFHDLSVRLGIAACVVHCEAPPEVLRARVDARHQRGDDSSEAGLSVLHWQEMHCEPVQAEELFALFEAGTVVVASCQAGALNATYTSTYSAVAFNGFLPLRTYHI